MKKQSESGQDLKNNDHSLKSESLAGLDLLFRAYASLNTRIDITISAKGVFSAEWYRYGELIDDGIILEGEGQTVSEAIEDLNKKALLAYSE